MKRRRWPASVKASDLRWPSRLAFLTALLALATAPAAAQTYAQSVGTAGGSTVPIGSTTLPTSQLGVYGNVSIGTSYYGTNAPTNGAIVQGNVGIGTTAMSSSNLLEVNGAAAIGYTNTYGGSAGGLIVSGSVGIGTTAPVTSLQVATGGLFSVTGTYNSGTTLPSALAGNQTSMFFYPKKGAFRAGVIDDSKSEWSNANIGKYSVAMGQDAQASGIASIAVGVSVVASGDNSTAFGSASYAGGTGSVAIGGGSPTANGDYSTDLGYDTNASAYSDTAIGAFNVGSGTGGSWVLTDPVFEIGIGTASAAKANAMTVLKNGNVGIGTTSPVNLLDIGTSGGVHIGSGVPVGTSYALYNNGGTLMWNGSSVGGGGGGVTTFSAGTTGLTPNSATSGAVVLAGTLGVANGGTTLLRPASRPSIISRGTARLGRLARPRPIWCFRPRRRSPRRRL